MLTLHHCVALFHHGHASQEARAKDMISQLKLEMNNLTRLVEAGAGLSIGEETTMNELLKQKEELTKERDAQVMSLPTFRQCGQDSSSKYMHQLFAQHCLSTHQQTWHAQHVSAG